MVYKVKNEMVEEFMNNMLPKKASVVFDDDFVLIDIIIPNDEVNYPDASKYIYTNK